MKRCERCGEVAGALTTKAVEGRGKMKLCRTCLEWLFPDGKQDVRLHAPKRPEKIEKEF